MEPRPVKTHRLRRVLTMTGVALPSSARDASLVAFERRCAAAGLRVQISPLPAHVAERESDGRLAQQLRALGETEEEIVAALLLSSRVADGIKDLAQLRRGRRPRRGQRRWLGVASGGAVAVETPQPLRLRCSSLRLVPAPARGGGLQLARHPRAALGRRRPRAAAAEAASAGPRAARSRPSVAASCYFLGRRVDGCRHQSASHLGCHIPVPRRSTRSPPRTRRVRSTCHALRRRFERRSP